MDFFFSWFWLLCIYLVIVHCTTEIPRNTSRLKSFGACVDLLQFSNSPSSILHRQFSKHNHFTFQSFLCLYTWHTSSRYCTHDILSVVCVVCVVHVFYFFVHRSWLYLLRLTHLVTGYSVTNLISRDQDHPSSFYVSPPDLGFLPSTF